MKLTDVIYEKNAGLAIITLDRPRVLNAMTGAMLESLGRAIADARDDAMVRSLVLTGSGRGFSAGDDIKEMKAQDVAKFKAALVTFNDIFRALWALPKPTIAALNGVAVGGGFELALVCDVRIAAKGARLGSGEVKINQPMTNSSSYLLPRLVGEGRARELALTGRLVEAEEAERIGLVNTVVEPEALLEAARSLGSEFAAGGPISIAEVKHCLNSAVDLERAFEVELEAAVRCFESSDQHEGLAAFLEKRAPRWTGR